MGTQRLQKTRRSNLKAIACLVLTLSAVTSPAIADELLLIKDYSDSHERVEPDKLFLSAEDDSLFDSLTLFMGVDGSKQPKDFGVNANLGLQAHINTGIQLDRESGLSLQAGLGVVGSQNAVQVLELVGEATDRVQGFATIGLFQRSEEGFLWSLAHDFLIEESYDAFFLSQWRGRVGYQFDSCNEAGFQSQLRGLTDDGFFLTTPVSLRTIDQVSVYGRHTFETGTQFTIWMGLADSHGEDNAVTGPGTRKDLVPLLGADFLAPLNDHLALYGETNLIMPADTGTVDAFLGFQWFPGGGALKARRRTSDPVLSVASPTTMSVDLRQ
ncbi:MAG: hypothetical protein JNL58_20985 [Planctomyces sp.]|nr:hypothetical protein [Planctomyces sp.]